MIRMYRWNGEEVGHYKGELTVKNAIWLYLNYMGIADLNYKVEYVKETDDNGKIKKIRFTTSNIVVC